MINEKKKQRLEQERVMQEQLQQQQQQQSMGLYSPHNKNSVFFPPQKSPDHVNSVYAPSQSSRHHISSIDTQIKNGSRWSRFINFFTCCNKTDQEFLETENGNVVASTAKLSQNSKSFKSSMQGDWNGVDPAGAPNSEGKMSQGSQNALQYSNNRNTSNSNAILYNILQYSANGYAQMYFGHYSFFQIPVRFEQHQYTIKKSFNDVFGRLFPGDLVLVEQTYLDWEFIASISKNYSQIICGFSSYMTGIPPVNYIIGSGIPNQLGNSSQQKNASADSAQLSSSAHNINMWTKIQDTVLQKPELLNTEFLNCNDLGYTVNFELFDRIVVIPMSLKQQGNAFDVNFNMRQEFRHTLQELLNQHLEILHKVVFLLPKYCKIKEVMLIIYDTFYKSSHSLYDLNFGIQFHSLSDEFSEVDAVALVFDQQQHLDTLQAISQRVFSNINPTTPSLALPSSRRIDDCLNQMEKSAKKQDENSKKQEVSNTNKLEASGRSTKSDKKSVDDFQVAEDLYSNKDINIISKQKHVFEFFEDDYVIQIGQAQFKNLYNFLRELNTQFIIQDHVFYYRTHVIDVLLKNNVIQQQFVPTLINHFVREDLIKQANGLVSPRTPIAGKFDSKTGIKKNKKATNNKEDQKKGSHNKLSPSIDFKDFFVRNSQHFTQSFEDSNEKSASHQEKVYSPSDYEYQGSEATTDQDFLHFGANNSHTNNLLDYRVQNQNIEQSSSLPKPNQMSNPTDLILSSDQNIGSNQVLPIEVSDQESTRTRIRQKQISCNYYTSSTRNKHIGFKSNKLSQSTLDEDILNRTTASKIFGDKKLKSNLEQYEKSSGSKQMQQKFVQEIIPEEIYNKKGQKSQRGRNFSQE